jgi:hypothetical protein
LSENIKPLGKAPLSLVIGVGDPVVVTVNEPPTPTVNVVELALVIVGGVPTVSVKLCEASGETPSDAPNVIANIPVWLGVPLSVPVPSWLSANITPFGSVPLSLTAGAGKPVVVTVNVFAAL